MKQIDKETLLKDLCARIPYGVKCKFKINEIIENKENFIYNEDGEYEYINKGKSYLTLDIIKMLSNNYIDEIKPFLFPLSSMTEEQYNSLHEAGILDNCSYSYEYVNPHIHGVSFIFKEFKTYSLELIDWLNKNHFDYRNLIERNLAIDCTNLNIY